MICFILQDQDLLIQELNRIRFFDVFEFNAAKKHWACFVCNHPEKMGDLLQDGIPVIAVSRDNTWKYCTYMCIYLLFGLTASVVQ